MAVHDILPRLAEDTVRTRRPHARRPHTRVAPVARRCCGQASANVKQFTLDDRKLPGAAEGCHAPVGAFPESGGHAKASSLGEHQPRHTFQAGCIPATSRRGRGFAGARTGQPRTARPPRSPASFLRVPLPTLAGSPAGGRRFWPHVATPPRRVSRFRARGRIARGTGSVVSRAHGRVSLQRTNRADDLRQNAARAMSDSGQPVDPPTRLLDLRKIDALLEHASKRAGFPGLIIAVIALCVASTGLWFIVASYRLQTKADRPNLATAGSDISFANSPATIHIGWHNIGKQVARRGIANLFAVREDGASLAKIGSATIDGAGTNVLPGFGAASTFGVDREKFRASLLLVCATYLDDGGTVFEQAFLFRPRDELTNNSAPLDEMPTPTLDQCRTGS
jgi:hypothetical protein